jgi:hypothetical protein
MTIDIPDELARQLESQRGRLAEIIARGLRAGWSGASELRREVVAFLARTPSVEQVLRFRPSAAATERSRQLLARSQQRGLSPEEAAELEEMCDVDRFVSLIKAEVLRVSSTATPT